MLKLTGIPISPGLGIGQAALPGSATGVSQSAGSVSETERFLQAVEASKDQIAVLAENIAGSSDKDAEIFDTHILLLEDPMFFDAIRDKITIKQQTADASVQETVSELAAMFQGLEDDYLRARSADIRDIGARVLRNLQGETQELSSGGVWVSSEVLPSDVVMAHNAGVAALVCEHGALNSHAAILARSFGIPAVFGVSEITSSISSGNRLIVNGDTGEVIVNASEAQCEEYRSSATSDSSIEALQSLRGAVDFTQIIIKANIGCIADAVEAFAAGAHGIGVVRTEFLFQDRDKMPDEEEQYNTYLSILKEAGDKQVAIRTLDAGSDKPLRYIPIKAEPNPSLGLRGLRLSLSMPEIFKIQLRAILRAAACGNAAMFFPMVTNVEEMQHAKGLVAECEKELEREGTTFVRPKIGAMIEVPSAAINARLIAQHADFLSIGTNDLVQYTLAVDRINSSVAHLYNELDPAVLELIAYVVRAGEEYKRPVSVCGEMAANLRALSALLGTGVREFSMSPAFVPKIRAAIQSMILPEALSER